MYKKLLILILSTVLIGQSVNGCATKEELKYVEFDFSSMPNLEFLKIRTTWRTPTTEGQKKFYAEFYKNSKCICCKDYNAVQKELIKSGEYVPRIETADDYRTEICDAQKQMKFYVAKHIDGKVYALSYIKIYYEFNKQNNLEKLAIDRNKLDKYELNILKRLENEHIRWTIFDNAFSVAWMAGYKFVYSLFPDEEAAKKAKSDIKIVPDLKYPGAISHRLARLLDNGFVHTVIQERAFPEQILSIDSTFTSSSLPYRNQNLSRHANLWHYIKDLGSYPDLYFLVKKCLN